MKEGSIFVKAMIFEEHGAVSNIRLAELPEPTPKAGDVLVKVKAVALNGFDPMILAQIPGIKTPLPMIPGGDIAGEIAGFGPQGPSHGLAAGMRVVINPLMPGGSGVLGETVRGGACELICVPADNIIPLPDAVSFEDAAALPIAYGTAHRMMVTRGRVKAGDKILVLGATGGVGVCCIQLAKLNGAEVAACTSSPEKAARLRSIGADHVINVADTDYVDAVKTLWGKPRVFTESGGADMVVNYVGGADWAKALMCAKRGGKVLTCGATNGYDPQTDIRYIWSLELDVMGSNSWSQDGIATLVDHVAAGRIRPIKSSVRPLEQLPMSLQDIIDRQVFGKAILTI